jgi:hypothetical protein
MDSITQLPAEDLIWEYHKLHQKIYLEKDLKCLSGLNREFKLEGKELLMWHNEVTRKCSVKNNGHFNYWKNFDDIIFCSDTLLRYTASLYLYRLYINNPFTDSFSVDGRIYYPNFQNYYGKSYSMFADIACQCVYNYWDRVGDMIASLFPEKIEPSRVFFPVALDIIPCEFRSSTNYLWLEDFRKTDYKELNEKRKQVVHYTTNDIDFKYKHLENVTSGKENMEKIQAEREALPDYFKKHIDLSLIGMAKTLYFFEEVTNVLFTDIA